MMQPKVDWRVSYWPRKLKRAMPHPVSTSSSNHLQNAQMVALLSLYPTTQSERACRRIISNEATTGIYRF